MWSVGYKLRVWQLFIEQAQFIASKESPFALLCFGVDEVNDAVTAEMRITRKEQLRYADHALLNIDDRI